ncbi:uncharacterized protein LOC129753723 [Uranotaenia lowii]|uniref:uncharacterized protein LOC129753723 n=1 Tax=Uranotaenia lowii TaxID=190385 RepID=UPI0024783E05|nr:uncharacterized protein LOC129753723 [Uranotaenia lowii]
MDKLKELQEPFVDSVDRLNETSAQHTLDHVRLPQIKLQTFSGNIDEWMSFRDLYTSLIHWKTDLPDVEKFHYLKGCLQGEPKSLIDSLQITRANYQVAWDLLVKRYNNSKLLKKKQVQALFKLPQLSRESPSELHCLVEEFHKAVQILDQGRHHTLVCFRYGNGNTASTSNLNHRNNGNTVNAANVESDELEHVTSASASGVKRPSTVLLATAVVWLEDEHGVKVPARALLDSGSECNFATERVSQLISASRKKVSVTVQGIGQSNSQVKQQIQAKIRSRISDFTLMADFLVLPKVTANLPTQSVDISGWKMPQEITLADPAFFKCRSVDLVLGIESFFSFFKSGREISLGNNLPTLIESVFGWVICGGQSLSKTSDQITCNVSVSETIEEMVSRFWLSEEIDVGPSFSPEEARCEEIFKQDVQRSEDGRYVVSLPKNESVFQRLGESKRIAIDRLKGTERRLARNPALHEEYHKFMNEYIELGHMQKVEERDSKKRCFLPHHPVLKEASTTTKVRVVFDASCKTSSGISLNDTLLLGPTIQQDLRSIILRSRTKQILIVSDVEKMFRQVYVRKEDRPLQCILWRSSPEKEIDVYEMNTVTYGTKPAPFLATRALKQLAMDEKEHYSRAAQVLQTDVYMDDVITGADSKEEAIMLRQELDAIMKSGGFLLRKWASNCPEVLDGISKENLAIKESEEILLDPDPSVTTLGLVWRPKSDILKLKFQIPRLELTEQLTKRKILSVIASLFDPLGLVGAAITTAKIFLQLLWTYEDSNGKKLDWDSPLPKMDLRHLLQNKDFQEKVSKECANDGIKWHFNPPSGPHFGGLWESAVRSAKQHLFKVMKETALSIEDMTTLLVQVEACLNSRPLTKMSDDPDDLEPLTPAHFLIGSSLQSIPEEELLKIPFNRLDAVQSVQKSLQSFWKRWKTEYLNQLQGRTKRWRPAVSIDVGRLVVIHEDHLPPLKWKMGRIHEVHPGEDDIVRVVTLKTEKGFLKRPVEKICLLPISESNESEEILSSEL